MALEASNNQTISEEYLRLALDAVQAGTWSLDLIGGTSEWNERCRDLYGIGPNEPVSFETWMACVHPLDRQRLCDRAESLLKSGATDIWSEEFRSLHPVKGLRWMHTVGRVLRGPSGQATRLVGLTQDVTERRLEEALQKVEKQILELVAKGGNPEEVLRQLCRMIEELTAPMLCSVMLVAPNRTHLRFGAGPSLPAEYIRLLDAIPIQPVAGSCGTAAYHGTPVIVEDITAHPLWESCAHVALRFGLRACWSHPIKGPTGVVLGTFAAYYSEPRTPDSSELKLVERISDIAAIAIAHGQMMAAVQEGKERFQAAVQAANEGIWDWNVRTNEAYLSPRWKAMLGYEDHEIPDAYEEWESRLHQGDRDRVLCHLSDYLEGRAERYDVEFRLRKKDGSYCWINACGIAIRGVDGRPSRMAGSHTDITERKRMEGLQEAEKQVLELVAKEEALHVVLGFVCRAVEDLAPPMLCSVMLADDDGMHLSLATAPNLPDGYNQAIKRIPIGPTIGSCGSAASSRKLSVAADIETDPMWKGYASVALTHGLKACWSLPIISSTNRLLGTLAVYHDTPREPEATDVKILERVSQIVAIAIEHAKMTEALHDSEARFNSFMCHSPAAKFIKDMEGHYIYANPQFEKLSGLSRNELTVKTVFDFVPTEIATRISQQDQLVLRSGQGIETEEALPGPDGILQHWLVSKFPLTMGQHQFLGGVAVNITERKSLEQVRADQADRLRLAMDIAKLATWDWNILTNQVIWSENCEEVKGLPHGSFDGTFEAYQRLVHPDDLPKLRNDIQSALNGQTPYQTVHRIVPPSGTVQWIEGNGVVYRDDLGRPVRMVGTARNITEQKHMEQVLRVNEDRYARATAVGRVGVWELDVQAGTFYGDPNLKAMYGYQPDELSSDPSVWLDLVHPDDQAIALAQWQHIVGREADSYQYESRMIRKDGSIIYVHIRGHALRTAEGELTHLIGATVDITDRKEAEGNLLRTQFAMDQAVDAVYWIDPQARILYTNAAASAMLGYTADEFRRMTVHDLNPDFPPEVWPGWWEETREKKVISLETNHLTKDGRRIPIDIQVSFLAHAGQEFHCAFVRDISARKKTEETAHRSLTLLQSVLNTVPIRVFWKDRGSRYLGCNQLFAFDVGCTDAREIVGKTDDQFGWRDQARLYQADDRVVMESECPKLGFEEPSTMPGGKAVWLRTSKVPLRDEKGSVIGVLGVYEDVTERKRAEEELRASQERFQLAVNATSDGIWDWNILTGEQYWSDHHLELFGLTPDGFRPTYEVWLSLVHPDDAALVHQATCQHLETGQPYDIEVRVKMKDGSYRWFRDRGQAVWDSTGKPIRMVGSISDVTERRQAEETIWKAHAELEQRVVERTKALALANRALQEEVHERKLAEDALRLTQFTVDRAAYGILWVSQHADICYANDAACQLFGYTRDELMQMTVHQVAPHLPPEVWSTHWEEVKGRGTVTFESTQRTKTGRVYYTEVTANYLQYEGQEYNCVVIHDITERKLAEEVVRDSELRYKLVSDATFDGLAVHDQGCLLEVNPGLERMFGYDHGELIGRPILDLVADESRDLVIANMRAGVRGPYEVCGRRKDGSVFHGEVVVRPYRYRGKEVRLVAGRDITARKYLEAERARYLETLERQVAERTAEITKLESQRAQAEKLAAMGCLVAGVAHEINNPIAGIKNAFTLVRQAIDQAHPHAEFAGLIDREIARVASIIQNLYQLCRPEPRAPERVDLGNLVRDLDILLTPHLQQRRMKFVVELPACLHLLCVPRADLVQVLLNLLTNAIEHSPESATITLKLQKEGDWIRLAVIDQGNGILPAHLPRIFDPFYTTKADRDQKGMGLGLSISQSLVQAMGGRIEVDTQLGRGSVFLVLLPSTLAIEDTSDQPKTIKEVVIHGC